jgi:rare lipoprotein A
MTYRSAARRTILAVAFSLACCGCACTRPGADVQRLLDPAPVHTDIPESPAQIGRASFYGPGFHGRTTASGETFDQVALTAAHRTLEFGSVLRVTNLANGAAVVVTVNDRGPYVRGRVIDLSMGAARALGFLRQGTARVRIEQI